MLHYIVYSDIALCLTYGNLINFEVFKANRNNLTFINMHLGHPLFIWDLKYVA